MTRLFCLLALLCLPNSSTACIDIDDITPKSPGLCVNGPESPEKQQAWLEKLKSNRKMTLDSIAWKGGVFDVPELKWTQTSYMQPQMHPYDQFFYDKAAHNYTVSRYLKDLKDRYGGIDSILMWPTYTNIGIDDRNQFDLFRSMPGGLEAVGRITHELHENGVRVLWPYNPWDKGTRRESLSDEATFAKLLKETGGDGFNGDTMGFVPESFWQAAQNISYPLAFEPEGGGKDQALNWDTMGWGYWSYPKIPVVDRFKFVTHGKFLTNVCDRWAQDKKNNLQMAWFNGDGYETWENVWGIWNGITPRDGELIRRIATMLRFFGKQGYLSSPDWEPHILGVINSADVFASKFPLDNQALYTFVNRGTSDPIKGMQLRVEKQDELKYYDCYHGEELTPTTNGDTLALSFEIELVGCVLQTVGEATVEYRKFFAVMKQLTQKPLSSFDSTWQYLKQTMVQSPKTKPAIKAPEGMVLVPKTANFNFSVKGVMIEGDDNHGVDVQYPWDAHPHRTHSHTLEVGPFFIDKFPVTTTNYSAYLKSTGFKPTDTYRWLLNWNGSNTPPPELDDVPVTYVSLDEARAYCAWAHGGSRLPHEWEWQYAAQGTDGRLYPWGNDKDQNRFPFEQTGNNFPGPKSVTAHVPLGDSPFGVSDLIGNVWQYTDEFQDLHTRAVILRGGSNYRPTGSLWYFPQAKELNTHNKMFIMDDRYERAGSVGFRCVKDVDESIHDTFETKFL